MTHIRTRLMKAAKAGYFIEWIYASPIAQACSVLCGRLNKPIPRFVKG